MTKFEIISITISIITLLVLSAQLYFLYKSFIADHERRKKQATIEYVNSIRERYINAINTINERFDSKEFDAINLNKMTEDDKRHVRTYLSTVEHLAAGVNCGVYDIDILERMGGTGFITQFNKFWPYIKDRRKNYSSSVYIEFEIMCDDIKKIRRIREKRGNIVHSKIRNSSRE
jgi:Tfp pilus assembly protein PilE